MDGNDVQNYGCITQKAVEDTISDKYRTKIFNIRRGSKEKLVQMVANVFSHEIWVLKLLWPWYFPILKIENFKSYVDVSHKQNTIEAICTYIQDVFISDIWIFEKSIEYRFNSALVRTKANYLFDASRHFN